MDAVTVSVVHVTAQTSFRTGATTILGAIAADVANAVIAVAGGTTVAGAMQPFSTPLYWFAFDVLYFAAIRIFVTALRRDRTAGGTEKQGARLRSLRFYTMHLA
ncbi:hypothetical protein [Streptomyces decoyicus]